MINTGKHIVTIVARTSCKKHKADKGEPCWTVIYGASSGEGQGVCSARVRRAGYIGKVTSVSIRSRSQAKQRAKTA